MPQQIDNTVNGQVCAARAGVALWQASELAVTSVDGPDAQAYLHNMLSADVRKLAPGQGAFALQLKRTGQALAALRIYCTAPQSYLLLGDAGDAPRLAESLERLHITEKMDIRARPDVSVVAAQGPHARQLLAAAELATNEALAALPVHGCLHGHYGSPGGTLTDVVILKESLTGDEGYLLVQECARCDVFFASQMEKGTRLGAVEPSPEAREVMRIEAGLPRFGHDLAASAVASELGIRHEAFSYDKGCYVGQEIIARIQTKGEVPFQIMGILLPPGAPLPQPGDTFAGSDGNAAASVTSAALSPTLGAPIAMARIKRGYQTPGVKLVRAGDAVSATGANGSAQVVELPFVVTAAGPGAASAALSGGETPAQARSPFYDQALALFAQDKEDEALALLERELEDEPGNLDALEALGVIHDRQGRHREAIAAMKRIVEAEPNHLMANVNLSLYYMKVGDKQTAEEYQSRATRISLERRMAEARAKGEKGPAGDEAERIGKLEARLEKFRAIIEMDPNDVLGHFGAGKACLDLMRFRDAAASFERVLAIQPDYSVAWANLGAAYAALGETAKACETFTRGIDVAKGKGDMMPARDMQARLERLTAK